MTTPVIFDKFNKIEVLGDVSAMYAIDMINNIKISFDKSLVVGAVSGSLLWQVWGKQLQDKLIKRITLADIASDPQNAENVAEHDIEVLVGMKGGLYTLSIYLSALAMNGMGDKMNLVDAVLVAYGGTLVSSVVRSSYIAK